MASVIMLDALGTLVALEPPAPALRAVLSRRFGIEVAPEQAQRALQAEMVYYRAHLQEGRDAAALAELRGRCAEVLRAELPRRPALAALSTEELTEALLAALHFRAFPDALPALTAARRHGLRAVVVSNWDCSLPAVLERTGLAPLLDAVITSAEVGARKPSPVIFARALERAGCGPDEALHVGDTVAEDIAGARAAGVPAVLLARGGEPGPPGVPTITSLAELVSA